MSATLFLAIAKQEILVQARLSWFTAHRMVWIDEASAIYGFINREHIQKKFGLSVQQASLDISLFNRLFPDTLTYDRKAKRYNRTGS